MVKEKRGLYSGEKKRSLRDIAKEIGVDHNTMYRIEFGHPPSIETFRKLCVWLGKSADELLELDKRQ